MSGTMIVLDAPVALVEALHPHQATPLAGASEKGKIRDPVVPGNGHSVHRVDIGPQIGSAKMMTCSFRGADLKPTHQLIYDCARYLLAAGLASEADTIETWRGEALSMSANIGQAAKWTVRENDRHGLKLIAYRPFDDANFREAERHPT